MTARRSAPSAAARPAGRVAAPRCANAGRLAAGGHLRPGLAVSTAGELLWTDSSPEAHELLVVKRGWSPTAYGAFVGEALLAALLPGRGR